MYEIHLWRKVRKDHHEFTVLRNTNLSNQSRKPNWHDEGFQHSLECYLILCRHTNTEMKQLFFTVCLVNEHVPPSWIATTARASSWMTWEWVQCVFPEMLKHLSKEIENHVLALESVELSRWAMNCTASFQLMGNTGLTMQERSFAPQREKNPQQENQCPPHQTKWILINPLSLLWEYIFAVCQPKHVSPWKLYCQSSNASLGFRQEGLTGFKLDLTTLKLKGFTHSFWQLPSLHGVLIPVSATGSSCEALSTSYFCFFVYPCCPLAACAAVLWYLLSKARAAIHRCFCHVNSPLSSSQGVSKHYTNCWAQALQK